jgi:hypothetical protein
MYAAPEGSRVLIKGCDKTSSWAHATFAERSREASVSFNGGYVKDVASAVVSLRGSWSRSTSAIYRELPIASEPTAHALIGNGLPIFSHFRPEEVYTALARVYKCKRRPGFGLIRRSVKIEATEGYSSTLPLIEAKKFLVKCSLLGMPRVPDTRLTQYLLWRRAIMGIKIAPT